MVGRTTLRIALSVFAGAFFASLPSTAAGDESLWSAERFAGLELRSIGPALMAGRIADIAIHPEDENLWYVAVGSGGVWKTGNAGVTWTPVFDDQPSYSIGCVAIDPQDPEVVWVGTTPKPLWCLTILNSSEISELSVLITIPRVIDGMLMNSFVSLAISAR